jgi:hypothetical protein
MTVSQIALIHGDLDLTTLGVKYFEPKTRRNMEDVLKLPESLFMLFDTIIAVDHFFQQVKVFT